MKKKKRKKKDKLRLITEMSLGHCFWALGFFLFFVLVLVKAVLYSKYTRTSIAFAVLRFLGTL